MIEHLAKSPWQPSSWADPSPAAAGWLAPPACRLA